MGILSFILFFGIMIPAVFAEVHEIEVKAKIDPIAKRDRILILAPHPDDETIGCAGVIQRSLKAGAQVKVLYLTNGDHNEFAFLVYEKSPVVFNKEFVHMGKVREQEAKKAMKLLGLKESDLTFLGYPDYGTDVMFVSYWGSKRPFSDRLTRQPYVPYRESPSYGAPYKPENILTDIKRVLLDYRPNKIFVSHAADVNGDHWSYYCFLQIALRDLKKQIPEPKIYAYLVHMPGWPLPRHLHKDLELQPYDSHFPDSLVNWDKLELTQDEIDNKDKAMLAYKSQTCVSAFYLLSFVRKNELFGDYPLITLKRQASSGAGDWDFFKDNNKISYALVDNHLWVRVEKPSDLKWRLLLNFYIFGYSDKTPFAKMPNIQASTRYNRLKIYEMNRGKEIDPGDTSAEVASNYMTLRIPLSVLGDPDFLLVCVVNKNGFLSLESMGFRRIQIEK